MITLTLGNSVSNIAGLTAEEMRSLKKILSYEIPENQAHFSQNHFNRIKYLIDKKGNYPSGLDYLVKAWLTSPTAVVIDKRSIPKTQHNLFKASLAHKPYPEQVKASKMAKAHSRGILVAPTGCGKSLIAALIVNELQVPTLIVVPSLELKHQLRDTLSSIFGAGKVGSLKDKKPLAIENVDSLDTKKPLVGYNAVIVDEFHHSGAKTYRVLNEKCWNDVYFKFGITATPFRSQDHEKLLLESVLSHTIYEIPYQDAVEKGYIVPAEFYYVNLPKVKFESNSWPQVYSKLVVKNEFRNQVIASLMASLKAQGASALCLVKEIAHGEELARLTGLHFVQGANDDNKQALAIFNRGGHAMIGTTGVLGEGVDSKPCEYVIIAGLGKSRNAIMQQIGRAFRVYPGKQSAKIIVIRDTSHKYTLRHFNEQVKIIREEYGALPAKIDLEIISNA